MSDPLDFLPAPILPPEDQMPRKQSLREKKKEKYGALRKTISLNDEENSPELTTLNTSLSNSQGPSPDDPSVWKEAKTPEGRVYYYNKNTRETSWTNPAAKTVAATPPPKPSLDDSLDSSSSLPPPIGLNESSNELENELDDMDKLILEGKDSESDSCSPSNSPPTAIRKERKRVTPAELGPRATLKQKFLAKLPADEADLPPTTSANPQTKGDVFAFLREKRRLLEEKEKTSLKPITPPHVSAPKKLNQNRLSGLQIPALKTPTLKSQMSLSSISIPAKDSPSKDSPSKAHVLKKSGSVIGFKPTMPIINQSSLKKATLTSPKSSSVSSSPSASPFSSSVASASSSPLLSSPAVPSVAKRYSSDPFNAPDSDENLIYHKEDAKQHSIPIKGVTLEKLIQKITETTDVNLTTVFIFTWFYLCDEPNQMLDILQSRYEFASRYSEKKRDVIQLRTFKIIKDLLSKFHTEFSEDRLNKLIQWVSSLNVSEQLKPLLQEIVANKWDNSGPDKKGSVKMPKPLLAKVKDESKLHFSDIPVRELARQQTLIDFQYLQDIKISTFLDFKKANSSLQRATDYFNRKSAWVSTRILSEDDPRKRAIIINRFIFFAKELIELRNYNAAMFILAALQSAHINRLKKTWECLPQKTFVVYESLRQILDGDNHWKNFRKILKNAPLPLVPYLGLYLTDLVLTEDGNPTYIKGTKLINLKKLDLFRQTLSTLHNIQSVPFHLMPVPAIQNFLDEKCLQVVIEDDNALYSLSLKREPRQ